MQSGVINIRNNNPSKDLVIKSLNLPLLLVGNISETPKGAVHICVCSDL